MLIFSVASSAALGTAKLAHAAPGPAPERKQSKVTVHYLIVRVILAQKSSMPLVHLQRESPSILGRTRPAMQAHAAPGSAHNELPSSDRHVSSQCAHGTWVATPRYQAV